MTELQLYKFCQDKEIEWREDRLILWIPYSDIEEFVKMIGYDYFSDVGIDVCLLYNCIAVELNEICADFEIDPENILEKDY
ncbi:hypothetical protein BR63_19085 [Thermanaerosceptrum fracticalcis]|uniref:Uncharacterized protein n=1 Tax=Thermanaerosceptrum fracticalcis TaxID=1712410 RepID=A0A7G6E7Y4_THEFR|nr:hypothetical protein [Thermanaerosceptrum fracticalcis]QNB48188.1 hypothetical protein BR63_19085 [Thermanaerosceptrum fracticalcis]